MSEAEPAFGGYIDFWGPAGAQSLIGGWLGHPWRALAGETGLALQIRTADGTVQTQASGMVFPRADIAAVGVGAILLADVPADLLDGLQWVDIRFGNRLCRMTAAPSAARLDARALRDSARPLLLRAAPVDHRQVALGCLDIAEDGYAGAAGRAVLTLDAVLDCSPQGALVLGRLCAPELAVARVTLACGNAAAPLPPNRVLAGPWNPAGAQGFEGTVVCLLPSAALQEGERWLEMGLACGLTARALLPTARRADRAALLMALTAFGDTGDMDRVFDHIAGPAIGALHKAIRARKPVVAEHLAGPPPGTPRASLVIPLHGRIDYMEVQLALFSAQPCMAGAEIIYVVDDPPAHAAACGLADSAFARFGVPCRLLLPDRNSGFAAASNIGLAAARGATVVFLNSDVFSDTPDWLDRLAARLDADPKLGVVGPRLLFSDGSVQHQGMMLEAQAAQAGWHFPRHTRKGLRPEGAGLAACPAITGACMVMRRALAERLGGFDESFVIGDFEDSDLCARAVALGFSVAVDLDVSLVHLERKSQGSDAPWRAGATLYNAWLHERRWFAEAQPAAVPAVRRRRG